MIVGWACGVRRRGQTPLAQSRNHPSLYHIRVWYGRTIQTSALSKWYKDGGQWVRLTVPTTGLDLKGMDF